MFSDVQYMIELNDPVTSANGKQHVWLDGVQRINLNNVQWRSQIIPGRTELIERVQFNTWTGGNAEGNRHPQDNSIYFDNIIVSDNPITHE